MVTFDYNTNTAALTKKLSRRNLLFGTAAAASWIGLVHTHFGLRFRVPPLGW